MTSDVGITKVGISVDPVFRLIDVTRRWPVIRRVHVGYGMSGHDAAAVERAVHRKLLAVRHEKELFNCSAEHAVTAIEQVIDLFSITFVPFVIPNIVPRPMRKLRVPKGSPKETIPLTIRVEPALKEKAEQMAANDRRTVSSWVAGLIEDAARPLARSRKRVREPVTAGSSR